MKKTAALSRFELYQDMKVVTSHERIVGSARTVCDTYRSNHTCSHSHTEYDYNDTYGPFASWQGCVEVRPYPYNVDDTPASGGLNNTGIGVRRSRDHVRADVRAGRTRQSWKVTQNPLEPNPTTYGAANSWWNDDPSSTTGKTRRVEHGQVLSAAADRCSNPQFGHGSQLQLHHHADHTAHGCHPDRWACYHQGCDRPHAAQRQH
ncbi:hypothetical protein ACVOMV_33825 [Mesorhizobium atlanticum]